MKKYIRPEMTISLFRIENIITASGIPSPDTLVDGKDNGQPMTESYSSLFGGN